MGRVEGLGSRVQGIQACIRVTWQTDVRPRTIQVLKHRCSQLEYLLDTVGRAFCQNPGIENATNKLSSTADRTSNSDSYNIQGLGKGFAVSANGRSSKRTGDQLRCLKACSKRPDATSLV